MTSRPLTYTYELPWALRHEICNLLDADQSWRILGGHIMALDATTLSLIGQATLRNASPADELFKRLDSCNTRVMDLCAYLQQMNHHRALDILLAHIQQQAKNQRPQPMSLNTPTPSFSDDNQVCLMNSRDLEVLAKNENYDKREWDFLASFTEVAPNEQQAAPLEPAPPRCHKSQASEQLQQPQCTKQANNGPLLERVALANNRVGRRLRDPEVLEQLNLIVKISHEELRNACDGFSDARLLGSGGFAKVYLGSWKGTEVAVKRLCEEHMEQALNELIMLNKYKIDHILPLYGISIDGPELCLVSQYMVNGSLEDRLACKNASAPLSWEQRFHIAERVAKGLHFLHTVQPNKPLIHGDIKPGNVLLDAQFHPKLADFGMAKHMFPKGANPASTITGKFGASCTHCTATSVQGTAVYLPFEYMKKKTLSEAVDAYSYGIVLLEMATGKRALMGNKPLVDFVAEEMKQVRESGGAIWPHSLKEPRLLDEHPISQRIWFEVLLTLGINCSHADRRKRLKMNAVLEQFERFKESLMTTPADTQIIYTLADGFYGLDISQATTGTATPASTRTLTPNLFANNLSSPQNGLLQQQQQSLQSDTMLVDLNNQQSKNPDDYLPILTELGITQSSEQDVQ